MTDVIGIGSLSIALGAVIALSRQLRSNQRLKLARVSQKLTTLCQPLGDGVLHRMIVRVQRMYFDPPDLDGRMPRVSKWGP